MDQRYHAPGVGRFMTPDRYIASIGLEDPGSWNRYAYVRGDPVNRIDPWGLADCAVGQTIPCTVTGTGYTDLPGPNMYDFQMYWYLLGFDSGGLIWDEPPVPPPPVPPVPEITCGVNPVTGSPSIMVNPSGIPGELRPGVAALADKSLNMPVSEFTKKTPDTKAISSANGNFILINPTHWGGMGNSGNDFATVLHELIHNVTGLADPDFAMKMTRNGIPGSISDYFRCTQNKLPLIT